jgi:hypothetical protein
MFGDFEKYFFNNIQLKIRKMEEPSGTKAHAERIVRESNETTSKEFIISSTIKLRSPKLK